MLGSPMRCSCAARSCRRRGSPSTGCGGWPSSAAPTSGGAAARGRRVGRRRRADDVHPRAVPPSRRSGDRVPAAAGAGLRRRLQRLHHVHRPALRGLSGHGRAPLRRGRDGRDDGLRGLGRLGAGAAGDRSQRLHRQRDRRHRPFLRPDLGPGHHAARADRLCRQHTARGRDVPRRVPGRSALRAGRLLRPRGDATRSRSAGTSPSWRRRVAWASGSTRMAAGSSRAWTSRPLTRCWSAMCRRRSGPTAPPRSWAG